jgi:hypothetical protein
MQSSPASRHFLPLRSKYSSQHPVLKLLQSILPLVLDTKYHIHTKQQVEMSLERRWQDRLNRMVAGVQKMNILLIYSWMKLC